MKIRCFFSLLYKHASRIHTHFVMLVVKFHRKILENANFWWHKFRSSTLAVRRWIFVSVNSDLCTLHWQLIHWLTGSVQMKIPRNSCWCMEYDIEIFLAFSFFVCTLHFVDYAKSATQMTVSGVDQHRKVFSCLSICTFAVMAHVHAYSYIESFPLQITWSLMQHFDSVTKNYISWGTSLSHNKCVCVTTVQFKRRWSWMCAHWTVYR